VVWEETPVGPYRAIFHFDPEDLRTLYASTPEGGDFVSQVHRFDEMYVTDIDSRRGENRWVIEADTGDKGRLKMEIDYRETPMLKVANPIAAHTPEVVARNSLYCKILPRLAAPIMGTDPNQKLAGVTETGRFSRFQMHRIYKVTNGSCKWGDSDLGPLTDCCFQHDLGDYRPISKAMVTYLTLFLE
jgi:hypothetical protein